jgi:hypothetical protein
MTHTLHRRGDRGQLSHDYVMLVMPAKGVNLDNAGDKMRGIWKVLRKHQDRLSNFGDLTHGNSHTMSLADLMNQQNRLFHAVFTSEDDLRACLREVKEGEFGISVVVSGLYDRVAAVCEDIGLKPHTVEYSAGVHGQTQKLPDEPVLEIATMCGHALVSPQLIQDKVEKIRTGQTTPQAAGAELSRICECGVFNPDRAAGLLTALAGVSAD